MGILKLVRPYIQWLPIPRDSSLNIDILFPCLHKCRLTGMTKSDTCNTSITSSMCLKLINEQHNIGLDDTSHWLTMYRSHKIANTSCGHRRIISVRQSRKLTFDYVHLLLIYHSGVTWASWPLESPKTRLFFQKFVPSNNKVTSKPLITWCGVSAGDRLIPLPRV